MRDHASTIESALHLPLLVYQYRYSSTLGKLSRESSWIQAHEWSYKVVHTQLRIQISTNSLVFFIYCIIYLHLTLYVIGIINHNSYLFFIACLIPIIYRKSTTSISESSPILQIRGKSRSVSGSGGIHRDMPGTGSTLLRNGRGATWNHQCGLEGKSCCGRRKKVKKLKCPKPEMTSFCFVQPQMKRVFCLNSSCFLRPGEPLF